MSTTSPVPQDGISEEQRLMARRQRFLTEIFGERFVATFNSPVLFLDAQELKSPVAIRFFKKDFSYLSKQLYLEYQYRSWKGFNVELLDRYSELVTKKLENINVLMTNTVNRLQKLMETQGHKLAGSLWPTCVQHDVPIIAGQARAYYEVLRSLEQVYLLAGTANLFGVIDSAQRAQAEFTCKKAVRAFRSVLQTEVIKLYREADRLVNEQKSAGHVDKRMVELVEQQGQDIKTFDAASDEESHTDSGMDLGSADAGQLIDDAAAASTAAAGAAKRRTTKKAAASDSAAPVPGDAESVPG
jgi:hypothetical protein